MASQEGNYMPFPKLLKEALQLTFNTGAPKTPGYQELHETCRP